MTALATSQGTPQIQVNPTELSDHQKYPLQIQGIFDPETHLDGGSFERTAFIQCNHMLYQRDGT